MRKVRDEEDNFQRAKANMKGVTVACADLQEQLAALVTLCKKTSDKHKAVFTAAAKHLDGVKDAATARQRESTHEVDEIRKAVSDGCGTSVAHLKGAKDIEEFDKVWHTFAVELDRYGKGLPSMHESIAKVKEKPKATDGTKAAYIKLAENCQKAAMVR